MGDDHKIACGRNNDYFILLLVYANLRILALGIDSVPKSLRRIELDILITGATGYVGSAIADALLAAGHRLSGLARSDESAQNLKERGIRAARGDMLDAESIREAACGMDAVVHAAAVRGERAERADRTTVGAALGALRGTGATFVYTSGALVMGDTPEGVDLADEETPIDPVPMLAWRPAVEELVLGAAEGVRAFVVRPAFVFGPGGGGAIAEAVGPVEKRKAARYVAPPRGEENSWTLVHRDDLGDLYARLLLLASDLPGGNLLLAAGDGPHRARDIVEAASRAAGAGGRVETWTLDEALRELGDYTYALALNQHLSNAKARRLLGWNPSAPSVFEELERGWYE